MFLNLQFGNMFLNKHLLKPKIVELQLLS